MANSREPLAEVQVDIPSQTAGQNILDVVASIWFEPGEIHVDGTKITFGFVRTFFLNLAIRLNANTMMASRFRLARSICAI